MATSPSSSFDKPLEVVKQRRAVAAGRRHARPRIYVPVPVAPDGGWGWMVVLSSFFIHALNDGIMYSGGVFFVEFREYFKGSASQVSAISSIMVGVTFGSGPIGSALTNRYGCRAVAISGSFVSATGFILSSFAPNVAFLCFSFGFLSGLGFGLSFLPAIIVVNYYFEKKRVLALGIAVCGSGVGTFVMAPVCEHLINTYTWQGAMLMVAGITLNVVVCGALMRPLVWKPKPRTQSFSTIESDASELVLSMSSKTKLSNKSITDSSQKKNHFTDKKLVFNQMRNPLDTKISERSNKQMFFAADSAFAATAEGLNVPRRKKLFSITEANPDEFQETRLDVHRNSISDTELTQGGIMSETFSKLHPGNAEFLVQPKHPEAERQYKSQLIIPRLSPDVGILYRKDIFYPGSIFEIPDYKSSREQNLASMTSFRPELRSKSFFRICKLLPKPMEDVIRQMTDFSLMRNPLFLLFAISNFLTSLGFFVPYAYLPDRAVNLGYSKAESAKLISVIGVASTLGRLTLGFVSNNKRVSKLYIYAGGLTFCGIASMLSSLCKTTTSLSIYAASYGVSIGCYVSLTSPLLVDLVGIEKLTNGFGLTLLFMGLGTLVGTPLAGLIYDMTQDYDATFYMMGAVVGTSGIMMFFVPCIKQSLKKKERKRKDKELKTTRNDNSSHSQQII